MTLPLLVTPRMILRPWTRDDVDVLHEMWTTPDVRRYLWDDLVIPRETAVAVVESHHTTCEQHAIGYWNLHLIEQPDTFIGFCGFRFIDETSNLELMYGLMRDFWGRGIATEACAAAIDYLWNATDYSVLYARTDPPNAASVRVMQRLGMQHESATDTTITYVLHRTR